MTHKPISELIKLVDEVLKIFEQGNLDLQKHNDNEGIIVFEEEFIDNLGFIEDGLVHIKHRLIYSENHPQSFEGNSVDFSFIRNIDWGVSDLKKIIDIIKLDKESELNKNLELLMFNSLVIRDDSHMIFFKKIYGRSGR